jgi:hypothetical protein
MRFWRFAHINLHLRVHGRVARNFPVRRALSMTAQAVWLQLAKDVLVCRAVQ